MHTAIPDEEIAIFKSLQNLKTVIDVGARADVDYLAIFPEATYHLFEPNPAFFDELKAKVGDKQNVHLNNYGLADKEGELAYNLGRQSFLYGDITADYILPVKTLDWYTDQNGIGTVDFLKIDTEGFDLKVLQGGRETIKRCRYIQYEHWDDKLCFHELLENDFIMCYTGYRNVLCIRKGEPWPKL